MFQLPLAMRGLTLSLLFALAGATLAGTGGPKLTGRALVAAPRGEHRVFLTWRLLEQDGAGSGFEVYRSAGAEGLFGRIGAAMETTTYVDAPGEGTFFYQVVPVTGELKGATSNVAAVTTAAKGREWVSILPAAKGRKIQFAERHFADTDGDGELEFVTYCPQVPSYRGGTSSESYKLQVYDLLDGREPRWTFDTGMGTQAQPASGDHRADWDYEWTFKPVAWDIDGDGKAEIITLAKREGKFEYVVLRDLGNRCEVTGVLECPFPVADDKNNSRHFPFFAGLGGKADSFLLQTGTYAYWEMWAYDWNGKGFDLRWHVKSTEPGFAGNRSSSHTILCVDVDGDGKDEISNGATMLDDDGSVLWTANEEFTANLHIDGQIIADIDPANPGLEVMMHVEPRNPKKHTTAMYDARTGKLLWAAEGGQHLQCNIAANHSGGAGLDIIGSYGGHKPTTGFALKHDGTPQAYPYDGLPINGDRFWAHDWDGGRGYNVCLNFTRIFGEGGKLLFEMDLSDAPEGDVVPWGAEALHFLWYNVDIVGDYREEVVVQMKDGSVRAYLNTATPPARRVCKWQNPAYATLLAPGDYVRGVLVLPKQEYLPDVRPARPAPLPLPPAAPRTQPANPLASGLGIGSGKAYEWARLAEGAKIYTDRTFVARTVPPQLAGQWFLRTANDDKASDPDPARPFITFTAERDLDVYVLYTDVATTLGGKWLNEANGWRPAGFTVLTTVACEEAARHVRCKPFAAGQRVELPGNGSTSRVSSMYHVVLCERKR